MSRVITLSIAFLFAVHLSFSQQNEAANVLLQKARETLYDDPAQTLKITGHLLHNSLTAAEKSQTYLLQIKANMLVGDFAQSIACLKKAENAAKQANDRTIQFQIYLLAAEIYRFLDLSDIARDYQQRAINVAQREKSFTDKLEFYAVFAADTITSIPKAQRLLKTIPAAKYSRCSLITRGTPNQVIARAFRHISQADSAATYLQKDVATLPAGNYWKMASLTDQSAYLFEQKNYKLAISKLNLALGLEKKINNARFLNRVYQLLSDCYLASGNNNGFREFRQKATMAENDYDTQITTATNFAFETLQNEKTQQSFSAQAFANQTYCILGFVVLILLGVWLFTRWLYATRIDHLKDIVNYLKLIKKSGEKTEIAKPLKNLAIPKETEDLLLAKLERFEAGNKYLSNEISLALMAGLFETNTKYLSEVINKYKGKNVNLYINELRIQYIVEKLKTEPRYRNYKVSYLARESGFSSHSSFSAIFKSITGITPHVFIQFLSEDEHQHNATISSV